MSELAWVPRWLLGGDEIWKRESSAGLVMEVDLLKCCSLSVNKGWHQVYRVVKAQHPKQNLS